MINGQPSVCIVGAGAAGLSAAWYLNKAGYTNVTVIESAGRVGGKCWSVPIPPTGRVVEMGAVEVTPAYPNVLEIAQEVGAPMQVEPARGTANLSTGQIVWNARAVTEPYSFEEVALAALRYWAYVDYVYYDYVSAPGMAGPIGANGVPTGIPEELCVPMSNWLAATGLQALTGLFAYAATVYGYGDMTQTPAAYMLRYMESKNFGMVMLNALEGLVDIPAVWPKNFTYGYQDLWARVAARLGNVRLSTRILGITRGSPIAVSLADGTTPLFDKLIVTCCLDSTLPGLIRDLTPTERALFARTAYTDYYTTAVRMGSFPGGVRTGSYGEVPLPPKGHAWGVFKVWEDLDAAVYYSVSPRPNGGDLIYQFIVEDAKILGYPVGPIIESGGVKLQQQWSYFPHVPSDGLSSYYLTLEALQGQRNTFYSGGLLSFETVHNVVSYSKSLVARNFPACPGSR